MNTYKRKKLLKIFISTLSLSAFTFGGGYVIVTLMKKKFVDEYGWIAEKEMLDLVAIAQSAPGPIAVNGAIVVGYKIMGIPGILAAILGTILPPFLIIALVSFFYALFAENPYVQSILDGMQAGVGAVIAAVVYDMTAGVYLSKDWFSIGIIVIAFFANCVLHINAVWLILLCGAVGITKTILEKRKER